MNVKFIDTFDEIDNYRKKHSEFSLETWKQYADNISPTLYNKCFSNASEYNFEKNVIPVVSDAIYNSFYKITSAHEALVLLSGSLNKRINVIFKVDFDVDVIFYLGLCNGAGWATELDGQTVVLLGAEKIAELNWYDPDTLCDLVCHELAHHIHFELRKKIPKPENSAVWQLYTEGFATRYSQVLYKEDFYCQNQNGWLDFCKSHISDIKHEYLSRIKANEKISDFFGDWNTYMGYSDLGYYLGSEFIRWLQEKRTDEEVACMLPDELQSNLIMFLGVTQ